MAFLEEWLEIGGFSLSTPGWTHVDLSGLLDRPDKRTSTKVIPGGGGVLAYPIRRTVTKRMLPMVIFGDFDGDGDAHADARAGFEANVEAIHEAVVDPPTDEEDGTRLALLHVKAGVRAARVRVVGSLQLAMLSPTIARATLDLEFPYGMFGPPGGEFTGTFSSGY